MADKKTIIFEVDVEVQGNADEQINKILESSDTLRKKFQDLRKAALEAADPEIANKFAAAAGEIKDQIGDLNQRINNFASDSKNLDVAISAVSGVAAAFSVAQGAAGLFGEENKDLQKTLVKVQSSIALLNGLQQIQNTLQKESAIGAKVQAASQAVLSSSLFGTSTAAKVLRVSLAATGVGLLVIGVAALITNFDTFKEKIFGLIPGLKAFADFIGSIVQGFTDLLGITSEAGRELEALEGNTKKLNEANERQIAILEATGGKEKEIYALKVKNIDNEIALLNKKQQVNKKLTEEEQKQALDLANQKEVLRIQEEKRIDDAAKEAADKEKKRQEDAAKKYQEYLKKLDEVRVANKNREIALIEDGNARELALFDFQREEIRKKAKEAGQSLVLVDKETERLRTELLKKQQEEKLKLILNDAKILAEADGKITIEELKKVQAEELNLLKVQLDNKKITQAQFDAAVIAQQTTLQNTITDIEQKANEQRLKDTEDYYKLLELKAGENGLSLDQVQMRADTEAKIYKDMLDKKLISQQEYDIKIAEGQATVDAKNKEVLNNQLNATDMYYQTLALKQGEYGLTLEQRMAQLDEEAVVYKSMLDKNLISQDEYNLKVAENDQKRKEAKDEEAAQDRQLNEQRVAGALNTLDSIQTLTTFFAGKDEKQRRKAFEINKKLQIAQALIQTYQGAASAFASASANPLTVLFPPYPFIQAAAAVAAGLANVAKIKSQTYQGGGSGGGSAPSGGGGGAGGAVIPPPNPFQGQQASGVIAPTGRPTQQTDNRVFVVESDITKTQNRVRVIESNSNVV